jgi:hypothetical protein
MHSYNGLTHDNILLLRIAITADVCGVRSNAQHDPDLIARLRTYERTAWALPLDAQTTQIILSGRRLLGDQQDLRPEHLRSAEKRVRRKPPGRRAKPVTLAAV